MLDRPETVSYLLASALFFALAVPLAAQRIAPNRFYGVRTRATLRNPALWYRRNRVFGVALMITSATFIVVAEYCRLRGGRPRTCAHMRRSGMTKTFAFLHLAAYARAIDKSDCGGQITYCAEAIARRAYPAHCGNRIRRIVPIRVLSG